MDWTAALLTFQLASATALILLVVGLPLAYWLATTRLRGRFVVEAVVALPIVLPPTVLGFYLLLALGPRGPVGRAVQSLTGAALPFTFNAILIGSVLFNLPFAVRPFTAAFAAVASNQPSRRSRIACRATRTYCLRNGKERAVIAQCSAGESASPRHPIFEAVGACGEQHPTVRRVARLRTHRRTGITVAAAAETGSFRLRCRYPALLLPVAE